MHITYVHIHMCTLYIPSDIYIHIHVYNINVYTHIHAYVHAHIPIPIPNLYLYLYLYVHFSLVSKKSQCEITHSIVYYEALIAEIEKLNMNIYLFSSLLPSVQF